MALKRPIKSIKMFSAYCRVKTTNPNKVIEVLKVGHHCEVERK